MTYKELLEDPLWIAKRHWIIRRDKYHCQNCKRLFFPEILKAKSVLSNGIRTQLKGEIYIIFEDLLNLQVHHKYYIKGNDPWEYQDDALITLCPECHKNEHEKTEIPVFKNNVIEKHLSICDRCGGSGYLPQYHYNANGICFKCYGEGIDISEIS